MTREEYHYLLSAGFKYRALNISNELIDEFLINYKDILEKYKIKVKIVKILDKEDRETVLMFANQRLSTICINENLFNFLLHVEQLENCKLFDLYNAKEFLNYAIFHEIAHILCKRKYGYSSIVEMHNKDFINELKSIFDIKIEEEQYYECEYYFYINLLEFEETINKNKLDIFNFHFLRDLFKNEISIKFGEKTIKKYKKESLVDIKKFNKSCIKALTKFFKEYNNA
jgi:hypothetical protein